MIHATEPFKAAAENFWVVPAFHSLKMKRKSQEQVKVPEWRCLCAAEHLHIYHLRACVDHALSVPTPRVAAWKDSGS